MNLTQAVTSCFRRYADFSGRSSRSEFWYYVLFTTLVYLLLAVGDALMKSNVLTVIFQLGTFLPSVAVTVRRLHDTNHSGWWYLGLGLIVPAFWVGFGKSDADANRFGPNPLGPPPGAGPAASPGQSPARLLFERALRRLSTQGKGVSVPLPIGTDEATLDLGYHPDGEVAYAIMTRDADEVALQLDFKVPPPEAPNHEQQIQRIASELTLQAEKRLPRMSASVQERLWDRTARAKEQRRPQPEAPARPGPPHAGRPEA